MAVRCWINQVTFSDGTVVDLGADEVVVIVGPNNSGKSAALKTLSAHVTQALPADASTPGPSVHASSLAQEGSEEEMIAWVEANVPKTRDERGTYQYSVAPQSGQVQGARLGADALRTLWRNKQIRGQLGPFFFRHLSTDDRLKLVGPVASVSVATPPTHPIHHLHRSEVVETRIANQFYAAFGQHLVVNRGGGASVSIHVGATPAHPPFSMEHAHETAAMPQLNLQGDGMRAYAGILLNSATEPQTSLLIDEPEAFLHPPQARLLAYSMAKESAGRQLIVATHSTDIVQGFLASGRAVRVVRLQRSGNIGSTTELRATDVDAVWRDPLLRQTNILDGLFHENVVVCEADSDCQFYGALVDAMNDSAPGTAQRRDVMFVHCGGKQRVHTVVRALRAVKVPVAVVCDFDVLNDEQPLRRIVEAYEGDWLAVASDWKVVKSSVDAKRPDLTLPELKEEVIKVLDSLSDQESLKRARKKIEDSLKQASPWATAKQVGLQYVPSGDATNAAKRLLQTLAALRIFVVPIGELEGFCKTAGGHGPSWVNEVLQKNLLNDPELGGARSFVTEILPTG